MGLEVVFKEDEQEGAADLSAAPSCSSSCVNLVYDNINSAEYIAAIELLDIT